MIRLLNVLDDPSNAIADDQMVKGDPNLEAIYNWTEVKPQIRTC